MELMVLEIIAPQLGCMLFPDSFLFQLQGEEWQCGDRFYLPNFWNISYWMLPVLKNDPRFLCNFNNLYFDFDLLFGKSLESIIIYSQLEVKMSSIIPQALKMCMVISSVSLILFIISIPTAILYEFCIVTLLFTKEVEFQMRS